MPHGGLPNFGNATSGALMPFMAQSSTPSSLPEPQPARAADAAATTPAAASSTNPHPTDTHPQSHSRRSRSRHRRHRHSHSHTVMHHCGHDKSPRRHTTRRAHSSSRSHSPSRPHHRSRRSHRNPISLRSRSPRRRSPQRHSPAPRTTAPHRAPQTHTSQGSTSQQPGQQPHSPPYSCPRLGSWGSWTRFQPWTSPVEQTKAILTNLDPALPPLHADECWEPRTMDMDEPIAFEPSFYHLLGRESHGMVFATTWFPRPHP